MTLERCCKEVAPRSRQPAFGLARASAGLSGKDPECADSATAHAAAWPLLGGLVVLITRGRGVAGARGTPAAAVEQVSAAGVGWRCRFRIVRRSIGVA